MMDPKILKLAQLCVWEIINSLLSILFSIYYE